jgi:site-specific recombinase XerD
MDSVIYSEFVEYCKTKYKSKIYINTLKYYQEYLNANSNIDGINVSEEDLVNFISWLKNRNYSLGVINNNIMFIRAFYRFLFSENYISETIYKNTFKIKSKMLTPKYTKYYRHADIENTLKKGVVLLTKETPLQFRLITFLTYYTGIVYGELILLKRKEVDLNRKLLILPTRLMFFPEKVNDLIKLFFSLHEEKENAFNITQEIYDYFNDLLLKASNKKISFEVLRHNFVFLLQKRKVGYEALKYLSGLSHQSLEKFYDPNVFEIGKIYKKKIRIK